MLGYAEVHKKLWLVSLDKLNEVIEFISMFDRNGARFVVEMVVSL